MLAVFGAVVEVEHQLGQALHVPQTLCQLMADEAGRVREGIFNVAVVTLEHRHEELRVSEIGADLNAGDCRQPRPWVGDFVHEDR